MAQLPMLKYMREVLDDHSIPLEDMNACMIEAVWLIHMVNKTEEVYNNNGS